MTTFCLGGIQLWLSGFIRLLLFKCPLATLHVNSPLGARKYNNHSRIHTAIIRTPWKKPGHLRLGGTGAQESARIGQGCPIQLLLEWIPIRSGASQIIICARLCLPSQYDRLFSWSLVIAVCILLWFIIFYGLLRAQTTFRVAAWLKSRSLINPTKVCRTDSSGTEGGRPSGTSLGFKISYLTAD